jgi:hypothetical protein
MVGLLSPVLLAARACAQVLGFAGGLIYARRKPIEQTANSKPIAEPEAVFNGFSRLAKMVRIDSRTGLACRNSRIRP